MRLTIKWFCWCALIRVKVTLHACNPPDNSRAFGNFPWRIKVFPFSFSWLHLTTSHLMWSLPSGLSDHGLQAFHLESIFHSRQIISWLKCLFRWTPSCTLYREWRLFMIRLPRRTLRHLLNHSFEGNWLSLSCDYKICGVRFLAVLKSGTWDLIRGWDIPTVWHHLFCTRLGWTRSLTAHLRVLWCMVTFHARSLNWVPAGHP